MIHMKWKVPQQVLDFSDRAHAEECGAAWAKDLKSRVGGGLLLASGPLTSTCSGALMEAVLYA